MLCAERVEIPASSAGMTGEPMSDTDSGNNERQ